MTEWAMAHPYLTFIIALALAEALSEMFHVKPKVCVICKRKVGIEEEAE